MDLPSLFAVTSYSQIKQVLKKAYLKDQGLLCIKSSLEKNRTFSQRKKSKMSEQREQVADYYLRFELHFHFAKDLLTLSVAQEKVKIKT